MADPRRRGLIGGRASPRSAAAECLIKGLGCQDALAIPSRSAVLARERLASQHRNTLSNRSAHAIRACWMVRNYATRSLPSESTVWNARDHAVLGPAVVLRAGFLT